LQDTIYQFEHKQGVVKKIDDNSAQLAEALKAGTPIVITTLQKFPFVTDKIADLPAQRYAVIVDEASAPPAPMSNVNRPSWLPRARMGMRETTSAVSLAP
jgi:hypothetical protein